MSLLSNVWLTFVCWSVWRCEVAQCGLFWLNVVITSDVYFETATQFLLTLYHYLPFKINVSEHRCSGSNTSAFECYVLKVCTVTELSKLCNVQSSTNLTSNKRYMRCVFTVPFDGDYSGTVFSKHKTFSRPMSMHCNRRYKLQWNCVQ